MRLCFLIPFFFNGTVFSGGRKGMRIEEGGTEAVKGT